MWYRRATSEIEPGLLNRVQDPLKKKKFSGPSQDLVELQALLQPRLFVLNSPNPLSPEHAEEPKGSSNKDMIPSLRTSCQLFVIFFLFLKLCKGLKKKVQSFSKVVR